MEYPCPSLDNIPLPDGAQPSRPTSDSRKKRPSVGAAADASLPLVVSSSTTIAPSLSTDGQLTTFNMADVPLPSTKYNTENKTLLIPLPEASSNVAINAAAAIAPSSSSSSSSSKILVDRLFGNFLSQKIKQAEPLTKTQSSSSSSSSSSKAAFTNNSVEEMKRFLDKEIDQLSCKTSFSEVASVKNLKTGASCTSSSSNGSPESKMEVSTEKDAIHREEENTDNASTVANQRITSTTLPLKIKISDSSVALISLGHLGPPASTNQSQPEELIVKDDVIEEQIQAKIKVGCHEDALETKTEIVVVEEEVKPESNGGTGVEVKTSKSSKKHKHKKKKSHKHSKNKNKSTPKLRLHSKKHKSLTKSHSKAKHKSSSNGTKSPKKISKTSSSHSKSKSSKKSKKTKTKTESKSKSTESSQFENKLTKKSESDSIKNPLTEDLIFVKTTSISSSHIIPKENLITLPIKKEVNHPPESNTKTKSTKSLQSSSIPQMTPKCPEGDNIVLKDTIDLSSFQDDDKPEVQLPSNVSSSSSSSSSTSSSSSSLPPSPLPQVNVSFQSMTKPSIAVVAPLAPTVSAVSRPAPQLQTQPLGTSSAELPTKSHSVDSVTQLSTSVSISPLPTSTSSQPDMLICTPPIGSEGLGPLLDPKPSSPISSLNKSIVSSPVKNLPPLINPSSPCAAILSKTPPSTTLDKSGVKDVTPKGSSLQDPSSDVHVNDTKDLCVSVSSKQQLGQVSSSVKPVNKNAALGQSGLLGLAAYFKSKGCSPSSESTKPSKSSSKKAKCLSDSSDDSSPQKRSRSVSRKSSHLSASKHSSDKRKKPCPRSKRSRSWSRSRSRSRSRSKSRRKASSRSVKKQSRSRSRSRSYSNERGRQSSFRSSKRGFSRSPHSRSRNKTYGRSRSRSRSRGRNRVAGHCSSRSRSPSKRASYRHTRSRSYSRGRYRHRISSRSNKSKSRSRSRSRSNVRSRDKRSRSRSSGRHRSYRQSNNKSRRFSRRHSSPRSRSSSASSSRSRRCRSRSKSQNSLGIDKVKLHDIAVKKLLESGQAPKEEVASLRAGGKTVQGLIDYCKRISQKELESESSDSTQAVNKSDGEEEESPFIHHPFKLRRESQPNIVLNIKNSKPLPVLTPQEKLIESSTLRLQFPVSSGSQHRAKESQWVPVQKNPTSASVFTAEQGPSPSLSSALQNPNPSVACNAAFLADGSLTAETPSTLKAISAPGMTTLMSNDLHSQTSQNQSNVDNVFPEISQQSVDISQVMTERMLAVQKLQENPNDVQALNVMYKAQQEVNRWAESKQLPGQFTGSTGAKVMSQEELNGPDKRFQAWAKKEQLQNAAPVRGGIGMHLLQKMGWRQGEGLGKHNEGPTEPILVNVKVDRKGLTSHGEDPKKSLAVEVAGKHPVSALVELCSKCKWGTPMFQQVEEKGPDHKKSFMFKVTVNNITYQPTMPSNSKKNGRARAAILCLQDLGLLPRNFII